MAKHAKKYKEIGKKLKPVGDAQKVISIAQDLDSSREKGKKDPIGHIPKHLTLLKSKLKELTVIIKNNKSDKDLVKVGTEMSNLMNDRIKRFSQKPKSTKG